MKNASVNGGIDPRNRSNRYAIGVVSKRFFIPILVSGYFLINLESESGIPALSETYLSALM